MQYRMYDVIQKKKMGQALSKEEIAYFVNGYTHGDIPDYQASALCMAICCRGMNHEETADLTDAMMRSGDVIDLSEFGHLSVDKHSTGGVGDKTTLIISPIVAALGGKLAKMSGEGLGHTGGTIDKLRAIPGFRTDMSEQEFLDVVRRVGMSVVGHSAELAPADKKLYALRDVTATVDCLPLIASSIMSKKMAAGAHSIVLDVKCGSGAFMKTPQDAKALADEMTSIGRLAGRDVRAIVTNMDVPLGNNIGNALEVDEAVRILRGEKQGDLYEVCVVLAANMVAMVQGISVEQADGLVRETITNGTAYAKMKEWIAAQGGDVSAIEDLSKLPQAPLSYVVTASHSGYIAHMDAEAVGIASVMLGAGRMKKEDDVDYAAGIVLQRKTGDAVQAGEPIATLYASNEALFADAAKRFTSALTWSDGPVPAPQLIF